MPGRRLHAAARGALALAVAAAAAGDGRALAQGVVVDESFDADRIVNIAECDGTTPDALAFAWTTSSPVVVGTYTLLASDTAGCPSAQTARTAALASVLATGPNGVFPLAGMAPVMVQQVVTSLAIACDSAVTAIFVCLEDSTGQAVASGIIPLDLAAPAAPVALGATPGAGALDVAWTPGTTGGGAPPASWRVTATSSSDPADAHTVEVFGGSATTARIAGLQGGATYDVVVVAYSIGHNPSAASNLVQGTPAGAPPADAAATPGGGNGARKMTGGCGSAPGGLAALAPLAVPFALRRRARG